LDEGIRLEEAAEFGIVGTSGEEDQTRARVLVLACELVAGGDAALVRVDGSERGVLRPFDDRPGPIGDQVRGAEVIAVEEAEYGGTGRFRDWHIEDVQELAPELRPPRGRGKCGLLGGGLDRRDALAAGDQPAACSPESDLQRR